MDHAERLTAHLAACDGCFATVRALGDLHVMARSGELLPIADPGDNAPAPHLFTGTRIRIAGLLDAAARITSAAVSATEASLDGLRSSLAPTAYAGVARADDVPGIRRTREAADRLAEGDAEGARALLDDTARTDPALTREVELVLLTEDRMLGTVIISSDARRVVVHLVDVEEASPVVELRLVDGTVHRGTPQRLLDTGHWMMTFADVPDGAFEIEIGGPGVG
jgi:hypothetical protein